MQAQNRPVLLVLPLQGRRPYRGEAFARQASDRSDKKANVETTEGERLQVWFGNETASIYLWQVAENLR